jgi:putative transposase
VRRAYKFGLRPTKGQHVRLQACLDDHRELYNAALQERRDAYGAVVRRSAGYFGPSRPKTPVRYGTQSAQLSEIRAARPEMARWSFSSQQATLRRLDKAFQAFFRRVAAGEEPGYPRFKAAHRFDRVEWPADGDGCRWKPGDDRHGRVYLQGVGDVTVSAHRQVEGRVKTVQVCREGRRWMLVLSADQPTGQVVGIDVGIASFAVTSTGAHIDNPRWGRKAANKVEVAHQVLARKTRGSNNRRAARETVAARHRKIANQRRHFHHKTAKALVVEADVFVVEDLKIADMVRRAQPRPDPGNPGAFLTNAAAAKTGLNRSISDAAGQPSSRSWAPKRKRLDAQSSTSTPGTPPTAAKPVGTPPGRTASARRCSDAGAVGMKPTPTSTPPATSSGLDWPISQPTKLREKKLAASAVREVT